MKPVALAVLFALAGCAKHEPLRVGVMYALPLGDKGFNDQLHAGILRAKARYGIGYEYLEFQKTTVDIMGGLRSLAAQGCGLVIANGFHLSTEISVVAREFPAVRFACVDYQGKVGMDLPPNFIAVRFKEQEGSFLVGAIAGLMTRTGTVGFVGGMQSPLIRKFEAGYAAGVRQVNPRARVLSSYAGETVEAFRNADTGRALARGMFEQGADIIYHAAGPTGRGVFRAAQEAGRWAIGVDQDQWEEGLDPATRKSVVLTSMLKRVDRAGEELVDACLRNRFTGGRVVELGLNEDGVGYVYDERNRALIPDAVVRRVEEIRRNVIAGRIVVPGR